EHKDSLGTGSIIKPGDVQRMTAGTGVRHSEYNASTTDSVHFLQIWIIPEKNGLEPSYEQKAFSDEEKQGKLRLVGSRDGRDGSVTIHQDVSLYSALLSDGDEIEHELADGRHGWIQVARGALLVDGNEVSAGDGVVFRGEHTITLKGTGDAEILLFDMGA
nr:pirin family protein [Woeseiaceae bacterium]